MCRIKETKAGRIQWVGNWVCTLHNTLGNVDMLNCYNHKRLALSFVKQICFWGALVEQLNTIKELSCSQLDIIMAGKCNRNSNSSFVLLKDTFERWN